MCHFVSYIMLFQKIIVYKTPPGGGGGSIASSRSIRALFMPFSRTIMHDDEGEDS